MKWLRWLFSRPCKEHDWWPTDFWTLEDGTILCMDTCTACEDFQMRRVS